jgi:hypothetical protein
MDLYKLLNVIDGTNTTDNHHLIAVKFKRRLGISTCLFLLATMLNTIPGILVMSFELIYLSLCFCFELGKEFAYDQYPNKYPNKYHTLISVWPVDTNLFSQ